VKGILEKASGGQDFAGWLAHTLEEAQQWLARIVLPKI